MKALKQEHEQDEDADGEEWSTMTDSDDEMNRRRCCRRTNSSGCCGKDRDIFSMMQFPGK